MLVPQHQARQIITLAFEHLADWQMKSAATFRNGLLGHESMLAINPLLAISDEQYALDLMKRINAAVTEGRMIDFGYIPNAVIKAESIRAREIFEAGEFVQPFDDWVGVTNWEGGYNGYYVSPHPKLPGEIMVVELYGVSMPGIADVIILYDAVTITINGPKNTLIRPMIMNYPSGHVESEIEVKRRGSNSLDPLVTMLRLLADASIPITQFDEPVKLNRARAKNGKFSIPGHSIVNTKDYVANFISSGQSMKGEGKGGTHASPIAHWRRSHMRHLSTGKVVSVRSSKVNWREADELHRMFYHINWVKA